MLLSPKIEVMVRNIYWNNIKIFSRYRHIIENANNYNSLQIDFNKIVTVIKNCGISTKDIIIVHSSYDTLKATNLSPEQIIDNLYSIVNKGGTLAMPAIRSFAEEGIAEEYINNYIKKDFSYITTKYDIYRTPIISGLLPFTLMRYENATISKFPLNPLVAIGADAKNMIEKNIEGEFPSAHGPNSSWAFCAKKNAWNIGIGVDIKQYLTIFHIMQEMPEWGVKNWFFKRSFIIKDRKTEEKITIHERDHKWTKYFAEINFYNDLIRENIIKSYNVDGIAIYITRSKDLIDFISKNKNKFYPYFIPTKYKK